MYFIINFVKFEKFNGRSRCIFFLLFEGGGMYLLVVIVIFLELTENDYVNLERELERLKWVG